MIYIKSRLIISTIYKAIKAVIKFIYKIFAVLNLQYALLAVAVGTLLFFIGVMDKVSFMPMLFYVLTGFLVLFGLSLSLVKLFGGGKKNKKSSSKNSESSGEKND